MGKKTPENVVKKSPYGKKYVCSRVCDLEECIQYSHLTFAVLLRLGAVQLKQ